MMVFITRFSAKLARLIAIAGFAACLLAAGVVHASGIEAKKAVAYFADERIEIAARFSVTLSPQIEQALKNGLTLPFEFEFQLTRPRTYLLLHPSEWFGTTASMTQRLSYQPLTRQYRVNTRGISRSFSTLSEALSAVGIVSAWEVLPDSGVGRDSAGFSGRLRMKLDLAQLPQPYQMATLGHGEWRLDSPWTDLAVVFQADEAQP